MHAIKSYWKYRMASQTKHGVHSPFVYDLITKVFENTSEDNSTEAIHECYKQLCRSTRVMETTDFGQSESGLTYATLFQTVSEVAKESSVSHSRGKLLYRLAEYFQPANILEMGTALGVSAMYLAKGTPSSRLYSMEGCAAKADLARSNFSKLNIPNVEISTGRFDTQLPQVLERMPRIDMVFMDGHHRYRPTLEYFSRIIFGNICDIPDSAYRSDFFSNIVYFIICNVFNKKHLDFNFIFNRFN